MKPRPEVMRVRRDDGEDADVLTEGKILMIPFLNSCIYLINYKLLK